MAASHQAAKLAASSLQVPVNPITGARVAQYEREDPLQALAAATAISEDKEEEKVAQPAGASIAESCSVARLECSSTISAHCNIYLSEELPNLEKKYPKKDRMMTYAKELINNMWTDFCVEDYIHCKDSGFQAAEKTRKKRKEWVPTITVPEPFQMMIREQKKKEESMKSKSDIEIAHKLLKNQEEDPECKKKFRANPVPAFVFFPLYHDLIKQKEEQRRSLKEKNKEALLASQKPFKFIAREEQKRAAQEKQLRDFFKSKKKTNRFKARPIPRSTYGSTTKDKLKEEELYRNLRTQLRAQERLPNSSSLPSRSACGCRNPRCPEQTVKLKCKYKARCRTPDFEALPERYQKHLSEYESPKLLTVCKPFDLHASPHASTKREKILADIKADEENLKETRWPYLSPRPCAAKIQHSFWATDLVSSPTAWPGHTCQLHHCNAGMVHTVSVNEHEDWNLLICMTLWGSPDQVNSEPFSQITSGCLGKEESNSDLTLYC
ncbi:Protein FAM161A [Plecturocebus cupreus]